MKSVHPLYQLQVVSEDDDVIIASTRPRKWTTQSTLTMQPNAKTDLVFVCSYIKAL
jgi:hypothetical protein